MDKRLLVLPVGVLALALGPAAAQASLVGDSGQSETQVFNTNQVIDTEDNTDGITVDDTNSAASNSSTSTGVGVQAIDHSAGAIVGAPKQSSAQALGTDQSVTGSGDNTATTTAIGIQVVLAGPGGAIVGSPRQSNAQRAATAQAIDGGGANTANTGLGSAQIVLALGGAIVGSPAQSSAQNSSIGQGITQSSSGLGPDWTATVNQSASNDATVGLGSLQLVGAPGSVIVGSPAEANAQNGAVGQNIAQDVTGDALIGTFDQSAANSDSENAGNAQIVV